MVNGIYKILDININSFKFPLVVCTRFQLLTNSFFFQKKAITSYLGYIAQPTTSTRLL